MTHSKNMHKVVVPAANIFYKMLENYNMDDQLIIEEHCFGQGPTKSSFF